MASDPGNMKPGGGSVLSRMGLGGMLMGGGNQGSDKPEEGSVVSWIEGSWLSYLDFDGKRWAFSFDFPPVIALTLTLTLHAC